MEDGQNIDWMSVPTCPHKQPEDWMTALFGQSLGSSALNLRVGNCHSGCIVPPQPNIAIVQFGVKSMV